MGFIEVTIIDIIDIVVVAVIMFYIYKLTKGTYAPGIITGIALVYLLWMVVRALNMELLSAILGQIIGVGVIALIVVFQPEIRRFLYMIGNSSKKRRRSFLERLFDISPMKEEANDTVVPIVSACKDMSATKTGALIVIRTDGDLSTIADTGIPIDARITSPLIRNLFFKNSPLHDGAVVVSGSRIVAAKCILPSTESDVPVSFGMRHRAALGMSEVTDAVVVVVSEETGSISLAHRGTISCKLTPSELQDMIIEILAK